MHNVYRIPMPRFRLSLIMAGIILIVGILHAQSVTVTIPASKDNTLYEDTNGALSNGQGPGIFVGRTNQASNTIRRGLVYFPVADSIPASVGAGAQVQSVELYFHVSNSTQATATISVHRATADWGEGASLAGGAGGQGDSSQVGDATWIHNFFDNSFWSQPGGDFESTASDQFVVADTGGFTINGSTNLVADVQAWVSQGIDNYGWFLLGDESTNQTAKRIDSREIGNPSYQPMLTVTYMISTSVNDQPVSTVDNFRLEQNYPNPFNPGTKISYTLAKSSYVQLNVFNVLGQTVAQLVGDVQAAGDYQVDYKAGHLPGGIYYYQLQAGDFQKTRKMILLK